MLKRMFALGLLTTAVAGTASADQILYWTDYVLGTDRMAQALQNVAGTHTVIVALDDSDFASGIASGDYDLGILFVHNDSGYSSQQALASFAVAGGRAIYADWSRDGAIASQLGFSFTGETNDGSMSISNPALAAGIAGNVAFSNPGWGVYATGLSVLPGSNEAAQFGNGDSAIVLAMDGRVIVNGFTNDSFSDGAEGVQLYMNEIGVATSVPEPTTLAFASLGILMLGRVRKPQ